MRKRLILAALSLAAAIPVSAALASTAHTSGPPPTVVITAERSKAVYSPKTLTAPAGTQFLLVFKNLSGGKHNVSLELRYMHISNAGLATPNPGVNTVQVRLGIGKFFSR